VLSATLALLEKAPAEQWRENGVRMNRHYEAGRGIVSQNMIILTSVSM
jgi:hypothetical protein